MLANLITAGRVGLVFIAVGLPVTYQIMAPAFGLPQFLR